jgi:hypothetical protein
MYVAFGGSDVLRRCTPKYMPEVIIIPKKNLR